MQCPYCTVGGKSAKFTTQSSLKICSAQSADVQLRSMVNMQSFVHTQARLRLEFRPYAHAGALAALAERHIRRKLMLEKPLECSICGEEKLFKFFRVPACGHACCETCYCSMVDLYNRQTCPVCSAPLSSDDMSVTQIPDSSALYVLGVAETRAAGGQRSPRRAQRSPPRLRTATGFATELTTELSTSCNPYVARAPVARRWVAV
jgi:hypothetical protein